MYTNDDGFSLELIHKLKRKTTVPINTIKFLT